MSRLRSSRISILIDRVNSRLTYRAHSYSCPSVNETGKSDAPDKIFLKIIKKMRCLVSDPAVELLDRILSSFQNMY